MKKSTLTAVIIAVLAIVWIGSGLLGAPDDKTAEDPAVQTEDNNQDSSLMKVRVERSQAESYIKTISTNGRSVASKSVVLKAEAEGQITEILLSEGETVIADTPIMKIDIREREERVREMQEMVRQREIEYAAALKLSKQGYTSDVRLAQTKSDLESAKAALTNARIALEKTTVRAPFDGILGNRHVDVGDYVRLGDDLTDIVDLDPLKVTVFVNEQEVMMLNKGDPAVLKFVSGEEQNGKIVYISPSADPQSRTFQVDVATENPDNKLPAGLTTEVSIAVKSRDAHKISPAILTLDDEGEVGVKTVNDDQTVSFSPVTIIADQPEAMWITGLPDNATIITVGQDFVVPGQKVDPVEGAVKNKQDNSTNVDN